MVKKIKFHPGFGRFRVEFVNIQLKWCSSNSNLGSKNCTDNILESVARLLTDVHKVWYLGGQSGSDEFFFSLNFHLNSYPSWGFLLHIKRHHLARGLRNLVFFEVAKYLHKLGGD